MPQRLSEPLIAAAVTVAVAAGLSIAVSSQAARPASPRTPDGHPDLTGTYDLAMLTPLERPNGFPAEITDEQAAQIDKLMQARARAGDAKLAGDRAAPPKGGDKAPIPGKSETRVEGDQFIEHIDRIMVLAAGGSGGYNTFWLDGGTKYPKVNGVRRTSIVIDPPEGRVPPVTPEARQRSMSQLAQYVRPTSDAGESQDPNLEPSGSYDDPERRPLGERCLLGFGSTSGPPALPNYFYNNLHQIVQTPDAVMILTEMVHDARIVRMNAQHLPPTVRKWMGDSVGHWEGDTLVVDTTNFTDKTRFRNSTQNLHVVERFTRADAGTLVYRFTVEDPQTWTRPWTGEYPWPATDEQIYEYACHEGNYALGDILRGARLRESESKSKEKH
jgi:hypothetical protein